MLITRASLVLSLIASAVLSPLAGQAPPRPDSGAAAQQGRKAKKDAPPRPAALFASATPLEATLTLNVKRILGDRDTTKHEHPYRPATLVYQDSAGHALTIPMEVRVRGIWRLQNCQFPPLRLRIAKDKAAGTLFERERTPKLVTHCRNSDEFEQYVLHEYAIYKMQALLTPVALNARLARLTYVDSASGKVAATRAGFFLEDEDNLARRLGGKVLTITGVPADQLDPYETLVMSLFQYMIGNTDWSVGALHNVHIVQEQIKDSVEGPRAYAIVYDWDWTGLVNTRYAVPSPRLRIRTVRDRLYRGVCPRPGDLERATALFNEKRAAILAVYDQVPGLSPGLIRDSRSYVEDFYRILNDPRVVRREIIGECGRAG
jgi:hypothetical protein